jgi:cell division protein FtsW (lipid II flippase)
MTAARNRSVERYGLVAVSIVIGIALVLVNSAKGPDLRSDNSGLGDGRIVNVNAVKDASEIVPMLGFIPDDTARQAAARDVYEFVLSKERRVPRIGMLSSIRARTGESTLFSAKEIQQIKPTAVVRTPAEFRRAQVLYILLFFVSFYVLHALWSFRKFGGDGIILPAIQMLCGLGFVMMISIRDPLRDTLSFASFVQGIALGAAIALAISLLDFQKSPFRRLAFVCLLASFVLSALLLVFGSGPGTSDAKVNLFGFQPVEAIKLLLILFFAAYFAEHWELIRELREKRLDSGRWARWISLPPVRYIAPIVGGVGVALLFFTFQKDLGPGLIIGLLFLVYYGIARQRSAVVLIGLMGIVAAFWLVTALRISTTVATRVQMWQSPWRNFAAGGEHLAHSLWAFSSGGVTGSGLGQGSPELVSAIDTDFIFAAIGEELGFLGTVTVLVLYGLLVYRTFRIMRNSPGDYSFFLCLGMMTITALQIILICGGVLGLVPLSGVTMPFLSYGRSSMLASFAVFGVVLAISDRPAEPAVTRPFGKGVAVLAVAIGAAFLLIGATAFNVQVLRADELVAQSALAFQADGQYRLTYNPRLVQAAQRIPRGTIYDRNNIPVATSRWEEIEAHRSTYKKMGIDVGTANSAGEGRHYPFGGVMFHLLGDVRTEANWTASNTAYAERDSDAYLQGFDDHPQIEQLTTPSGKVIRVERRDYSALIPVLRYAHRPDHPAVKRLLERDKDLHLSIDSRLQLAVASTVSREVKLLGKTKAAAVVLDPENGDLLASVSYPWPSHEQPASRLPGVAELNEDSQFDRARYGLYPPGSTFKLVTAMAALDKSPALSSRTFMCRRLPDGRVGNFVPGWSQPIRDDISDHTPHGAVDLAQGLIVSCNAYYAQLGLQVGAPALHKMASALGISTARPNTPAELRNALPHASYGQGQVVASPFQMARMVAVIANSGNMPMGRWITDGENDRNEPARPVISAEAARYLARTMRLAVTDGTGRRVQQTSVPVSGKTGTAEIANGLSHSWFVGFAPYGSASSKISFSVIVENGGYGGSGAAVVAGRIVDRAKELGVIN